MKIYIPIQIITHLIPVLCWTKRRKTFWSPSFDDHPPQILVTFQTTLIFAESWITTEYTESGFSHSFFLLILPNNFFSLSPPPST